MSRKKNNDQGFSNKAARKFKDNNKADLVSQEEIYRILDSDMPTILQQVTDYRNHENGAKYPTYVANMFANLSVPLYFYEFVKAHMKIKKKKKKIKTDLTVAQIDALRHIIADVYKRSVSAQYQNQSQEFKDRNDLLLQTFEILSWADRKTAKKLGLDKEDTRELLMQIYGEPCYNMRYIHKLFNKADASVSNKKKLKIMRKLYGSKKRFIDAVGSSLAVGNCNNSDFLDMLYKHIMKKSILDGTIGKKKKKKILKHRAPFIRAYAEAYKRVRVHSAKVNAEFAEENKKLIEELLKVDIGYKKAFSDLKGLVVKNPGTNKAEKVSFELDTKYESFHDFSDSLGDFRTLKKSDDSDDGKSDDSDEAPFDTEDE